MTVDMNRYFVMLKHQVFGTITHMVYAAPTGPAAKEAALHEHGHIHDVLYVYTSVEWQNLSVIFEFARPANRLGGDLEAPVMQSHQ